MMTLRFKKKYIFFFSQSQQSWKTNDAWLLLTFSNSDLYFTWTRPDVLINVSPFCLWPRFFISPAGSGGHDLIAMVTPCLPESVCVFVVAAYAQEKWFALFLSSNVQQCHKFPLISTRCPLSHTAALKRRTFLQRQTRCVLINVSLIKTNS